VHSIVEAKRSEVAEFCRKRGVSRHELFGSAARAEFNPERSDLDFLVAFDDTLEQSHLGSWFGLKDDRELLFSCPVDLVTFGSVINPYVLASIQKDRQLVYGA
jgi:predicted nucleotidyltransferase